MVVLSIETYSRLVESDEYIMDVADAVAESTDKRMTHKQVFNELKKKNKRTI